MTPELLEFLRLAPLGFLVGAYGTLVGAGGGSVLVPVLLLMFPHQSPASVTAVSLAVVFFNAYSGTVAYVRMGRVDFRAGVLFTLASLPGAVFWALSSSTRSPDNCSTRCSAVCCLESEAFSSPVRWARAVNLSTGTSP